MTEARRWEVIAAEWKAKAEAEQNTILDLRDALEDCIKTFGCQCRMPNFQTPCVICKAHELLYGKSNA